MLDFLSGLGKYLMIDKYVSSFNKHVSSFKKHVMSCEIISVVAALQKNQRFKEHATNPKVQQPESRMWELAVGLHVTKLHKLR